MADEESGAARVGCGGAAGGVRRRKGGNAKAKTIMVEKDTVTTEGRGREGRKKAKTFLDKTHTEFVQT